MAATVSRVPDEANVSVGPIPVTSITVTGDTSYPTGGYSITAASLGMKAILGMAPLGNNTAAAGFEANWNTQTGKLQFYSGALAEVTNATDVHTLIFTILVWGQR